MTTDNDTPTVAEPELPGVANLEPPKDLFTSPPPEAETESGDDGAGESDKDAATSTDSAEERVVTETPPAPKVIVDPSDWRDVDDDPWQADEDVPPPVIGS